MPTVRFLHLADVHLDTPFHGREQELRRRLRDACRAAFDAAVDAAVQRQVHAVLVAGDLFDNDRLSFATEQFLLEAMGRLRAAGIDVFYATGNHDPGRRNDRASQLEWPDNVHLIRSTKPQTLAVNGDDGKPIAWVTAAGHASARESENLAASFGSARTDLPHIAMLHAQVESAAGAAAHDRYAPCTCKDLAAGGFDYWALGHIHGRGRACDDAPAWYPGNIQGRHPRETGPKGALYVEVEKGVEPKPQFLSLAPIVWDTFHLDCPQEARTLDALTQTVAANLRSSVPFDDGREHLIRVELAGQSPLVAELADPENQDFLGRTLGGMLERSLVEIRTGQLVRPIDVGRYRGTATVLGEALTLLAQMEHDDELLRRLGPQPPAAADVGDEVAYLRGLLDGLDVRAAAALVPEAER
jgi:exonuclease SbcD